MLTEADRREATLLRGVIADLMMEVAALRGHLAFGAFAFKAFNPDQPRDEQGRWAPTGGGEPDEDAPYRLRFAEGDKTCQQLISDNCNGLGRRKFPSQFLDFTFEELLEARKNNAPGSDTAYKILNDNRPKKGKR